MYFVFGFVISLLGCGLITENIHLYISESAIIFLSYLLFYNVISFFHTDIKVL